MDNIKLTNNFEIPCIGFGPGICVNANRFVLRESCSPLKSFSIRAYNKFIYKPLKNRKYVKSVSSAIINGFRLIDYSAAYGDGRLIGAGILSSGVPRRDLIITTRISNRAQFGGVNLIKAEFFKQLKNFGTDYVDILMFHWPVKDCYEKTWKVMVDLYKDGYVKILGVANCHESHLDKIFDLTDVNPLINQIEIHPLFSQKKLISYCFNKGIHIESYTPLARFDERLMRLPILRKIAQKYNKTVSQVVLRWHIQNGIIPVVRAMNSVHQKENLDIFDFCLTEDEVHLIDSINIDSRLRYDPDNCDFSIL